MQYYSTHNRTLRVPLSEAVLRGLAPDGGLCMPEQLVPLSGDWIDRLPELDAAAISQYLARHLFGNDIPVAQLDDITASAINFPLPLVPLDATTGLLELWHGPTLAFKDIGARFMARIMGYLVGQTQQELTVIVATSGDTGGAVANGFYRVPGIRVVILYPKGRVSAVQECQFATLGENISAVAVAGSFDDCQKLVKMALLDTTIRTQRWLTSANSINIARLLPQSFYYFVAYAQIRQAGVDDPVVFSVPSGNFGNLTAGVIAQRLGLPVRQFVAATNSNNIVPKYLRTGNFTPRPSVVTLSNAMDVGDPSNFARLLDLYDHSVAAMRLDIVGTVTNEPDTKQAIADLWRQHHYLSDPHTAVAYNGLQQYRQQAHQAAYGVVLATAHATKFASQVEPIIQAPVSLPPQLTTALGKPLLTTALSTDYSDLQALLLAQG